jgi:hypothetical protein
MATKKPAKPRTRKRSSSPKGGRPTKCTPEVMRKVRAAILKGAGREDAARAAGLSPSTFHLWMSKAASGEAEFSEFLETVEGAESDLVRKAGQVLTDLLGSKKTPAAVRFASAKLILERRRADVWGPKKDVRVSGPDGGPVPVAAEVAHSGKVEVSGEVAVRPLFTREELAAMNPEALRAFVAQLEQGDEDDDDNQGGAG